MTTPRFMYQLSAIERVLICRAFAALTLLDLCTLADEIEEPLSVVVEQARRLFEDCSL